MPTALPTLCHLFMVWCHFCYQAPFILARLDAERSKSVLNLLERHGVRVQIISREVGSTVIVSNGSSHRVYWFCRSVGVPREGTETECKVHCVLPCVSATVVR